MTGLKLLAFDLGAESGRAVLGRLDGRRLALTEVHRFANEPVLLPDGLHWDALRLFHEIQNGLARAARDHGPAFDGIAVDTWGVDFALLGAGGLLLGEPYHYRDHRTDGILDKAFRVVPREEIYAATGIQFLPFNTLYQLWAMQRAESPLLGLARELLFMPGLFTFLLGGEKANDQTIVTTSQCYDGRKNEWASELTDRFGLPRRLFGPVTPPGTVVGRLRPALSERTGA
ncbi:MAG: FGGY family carbohydrate kinase, partial [Bacteroidota bacterium]